MTDIELMQSPNNWPKWPVLPLVSKTGGLQKGMGFLLNQSLKGKHTDCTVWVGNVWDLPEAIEAAKTIKYTSFEELAKEWRVD